MNDFDPNTKPDIFARSFTTALNIAVVIGLVVMLASHCVGATTNSSIIYTLPGVVTYTNLVQSSCTNIPYDHIVDDMAERRVLLTNVVNRLVKEGYVCEIIGHRWTLGCGNPNCVVSHTIILRHCSICAKTEEEKRMWIGY